MLTTEVQRLAEARGFTGGSLRRARAHFGHLLLNPRPRHRWNRSLQLERSTTTGTLTRKIRQASLGAIMSAHELQGDWVSRFPRASQWHRAREACHQRHRDLAGDVAHQTRCQSNADPDASERGSW